VFLGMARGMMGAKTCGRTRCTTRWRRSPRRGPGGRDAEGEPWAGLYCGGVPTQVTIVGGGSYQWGPELMADLFGTPALAGMHLVLEDIDPTPLPKWRRWPTS